MNIGFEYPWCIAVACILVIGAIFFAYRRNKTQNFLSSDLIVQVYKKNNFLYRVLVVSLLSTFLLFSLLLAQPYQSIEVKKVKRNGIDMVLVLDLSYSMLAGDIAPNRLSVAKNVIGEFLSELKQDRIGLVVFAGKPFQSVPLVYDYDFIQDYVSTLKEDTIPQDNNVLGGTAIGDALLIARDMLVSQKTDDMEREQVIILLTDGEANIGIDPNIATNLLTENTIKTYTVGIGGDEQAFIDVPLIHGFSQRTPVAGVDEETLQNIATRTGGTYFRVKDTQDFSEVFDTISGLEKRPIETEILDQKSSLAFWFQIGILCNIILQIIIVCRKRFIHL